MKYSSKGKALDVRLLSIRLREAYGGSTERQRACTDDIKDMVSAVDPSGHGHPTASAFLYASLISSLQDEAIRSLGYWMRIPPHFFTLPSAHVRVNSSSDYFMFSLRYMSKNRGGHKSSGALPHWEYRS